MIRMNIEARRAASSLDQALHALNEHGGYLAVQSPDSPFEHAYQALRRLLDSELGVLVGQRVYQSLQDGVTIDEALDQINTSLTPKVSVEDLVASARTLVRRNATDRMPGSATEYVRGIHDLILQVIDDGTEPEFWLELITHNTDTFHAVEDETGATA